MRNLEEDLFVGKLWGFVMGGGGVDKVMFIFKRKMLMAADASQIFAEA